MNTPSRCTWCLSTPEYIRYHDEEWGRPVRDDRVLFEFLILEGAQAGLSWRTILERRAGYRRAFADFDVKKLARYTDAQLEKLVSDPGIVRHRQKIFSVRSNAQAYQRVQREFGSFAAYLWAFVDDTPIVNAPRALGDVPAKTPLSDRISKDLKKRGFGFIGSTIVYAYLQAVGVVNDHLANCPQQAVSAAAKPKKRGR
mgnify:CR=1 FL=1